MKALFLLILVSLPARAQLVNVHFQSSIHFMENIDVNLRVDDSPEYRKDKYELSFYEIINDKWIPTFSVKEDGIYGKDGKLTCRYDVKKGIFSSVEGGICITEPLMFGRSLGVKFFVTTFDSAKKSGTIKMDNKTYGFKIVNFEFLHEKALWDKKYTGSSEEKSFRELVKVEEHEKFSDEIYKAAYIDHNFLEYFSKDNYSFGAAFLQGRKVCDLKQNQKEAIFKYYFGKGRLQSEIGHLIGIEKKYNLHLLTTGDSGIRLTNRDISMNLKGDELFSKLDLRVHTPYSEDFEKDRRKMFGVSLYLKDGITCEEFHKDLKKKKILE